VKCGAAEGIPNGNGRTGPLEYDGPVEENEEGKIMVTLDTLRREKKAEIIRLAEVSGCSNVRVFGSVATGDLRDLLGTEIDLVESRSIHPYIRDRVLAEAVGL